MNKKIIPIKGMHCRSCEILVEDELAKIPGVVKVSVNQEKGGAVVLSNFHLKEKDIEDSIVRSGYSIGQSANKRWFSPHLGDYIDVATCGIFVLIFYLVANELGIFKTIFVSSNNYASLPVVFLVGLTAGLSTCMVLVGGLILGVSARFAEKHPLAKPYEKFKPHLFFNLGRIISFFVLGGLIGYAGSFFQLSPTTLGILTIIVGGFMLMLGLQLTALFPRLNNISFTLPKGLSRILGVHNNTKKEYSHQNALILGGLTFFLPCGFTQAMQLFAIASGNPTTGALTMGVFALGTTPGLLGIGGLTSVIKGTFAKMFFKFAGIVVILLALVNMRNGYTLAGFNADFFSKFNTLVASQLNDPNVSMENGVQIVKMTQNASGYSPNRFTIKKDVPVRWIVNSTDIFSCASSIVSAKLGIGKGLELGDNIFEFTPNEVGQIRFSCSMGMYSGVFNVVDSNSEISTTTTSVIPPNTCGSCGGGRGCGCGGGAAKQKAVAAQLEKITPVPPIQEGSVQLIKATYSVAEDILPKRFSVKSGQPVRFEIEAKENGQGCMGSIALPGLSQQVYVLAKGKTTKFEFTPIKPGTYTIACAMGVPRGSIIVE